MFVRFFIFFYFAIQIQFYFELAFKLNNNLIYFEPNFNNLDLTFELILIYLLNLNYKQKW